LNKLTVWLVYSWTGFRFLDILLRGKIFHVFTDGFFSLLFWTETALILGSAYVLSTEKAKQLPTMFRAHLLCALGGMIYRFSPTTLAFSAKNGASYFPSAIEFTVSAAFVGIAVLVYLIAVKKLAILPGSNADWLKMAKYEEQVKPGIQLTGYAPVEH
jgi:Ni/Fe-hydrogenase subunit HybB-like protein